MSPADTAPPDTTSPADPPRAAPGAASRAAPGPDSPSRDGRSFRVMAVCTGNICRSPMAEVVLQDAFARAGLGSRVVVDSAGTSDEERGNPVDPRARDVLRAAGYDVPHRSARRVSAAELAERDLVLAMTARHAHLLRALAPGADATDRVALYRSFDPAATAGPVGVGGEADLDLDDPWYGGREQFESALAQVQAGADGIVAHVRRALDGPPAQVRRAR